MLRSSSFALLCVVFVFGTSAAQEKTAEKASIRGEVRSVQKGDPATGKLGSIFVEAPKEAPKPKNGEYDKATVKITKDTKIQKRVGKELVDANINELNTMSLVEVYFTGPVAESYPVQATAGKIVIVGKKEEVGRPILYGTTREFLEFFALRDLNSLPTLREFHELTEEHQEIVEEEAPRSPTGIIDELSDPSFKAKVAEREAASEAALTELETAIEGADVVAKEAHRILNPPAVGAPGAPDAAAQPAGENQPPPQGE